MFRNNTLRHFAWVIAMVLLLPTYLYGVSTVISIKNAPTINEPDSGTSNLDFIVEIGASQSEDVTFVCHTSDGTAKVGDNDYQSVSGTFTIPAGQTQATVSVPIIGDFAQESQETMSLTIDSVSASYITISSTKKTATGTINDTDTRSLSINSSSVTEGGTGSLTVSLSGNTATTAIPFTITLGGDAVSGSDYTAPTLSGSISAGASSASISIATTSDTVVEYDENITVTIAISTGIPITTATGKLTITNDDKYKFELDPVSKSVGEGDGSVSVQIKINQTPLSGQSTWVKWKTQTSSTTPNATADTDYTSVAATTVNFNPGDTSKTISVTIKEDLLDDGDEYFDIYLDSKNSNADWVSTAARKSTVKITDNDSSSLSIDDINVSEAIGTASITVRLNGPTLGTAATFKYSTGTYSGQADSGDFTTQSNVSGSIAAGASSTTITVPITNDSTVEPFEKFKVVLSNANISISDDTADVGINDNDTYTVSLSTPSDVIESATTQRFTASISPTPLSGTSVTLNYTTKGTPTAGTTATAGSDFTSKTGSITFSPTTTSVDIDVTILADTTAESDETYFLELNTLSSNAVFQGGGSTLSKSGKIIDDDNRTLSINDVNVTEGGTINLTVTMSGNTSPLATPFTISLGGTAVSGTDYTAPALTGSIAANSSTATISIPTTNDSAIEGFEYVDVTITSSAAAIGDGVGRGGITDNDNYILSISPSNTNRDTTEKNSGTNTNVAYTVTINQTPVTGVSVTVDYAFLGAAATGYDAATIGTSQSAGVDVNVSAISGTLTFTPGQTTKTIYATIIGDNTEENYERYTVTLSNESSNADINSSASYAVERILNDDTTLSIDDVNVTEGACGNTTVRLITRLSKKVNFDVTASYATGPSTPVSAVAGADYTARTNSMRINAGSVTNRNNTEADVTILQDSLVESAETFNVTITNSQSGVTISDNVGVVTINDNQANTVSVFNDPAATPEGDSGEHNLTFTLTLCKTAATDINVTYRTVDGTAVDSGTGSSGGDDYDGMSSQITILAGQINGYIQIPINGDLFDENDETFTVELTGATGGVNFTDNVATGTILDDDNRRLYINDVSVIEGNTIGNNTTATMRISLVNTNDINTINKASTDVSVTYTTADDSAKTSNSDYTSATRTVTIPAAVGYVDIDLNVTQDTAAEATERFFVNLSGVTPGVEYYGGDTQGIVTIIDDDNRTLTLTGISVAEGDSGYKDVNVTIELNTTSPVARSGTYKTQYVIGSADSSDFEPITTPLAWSIPANDKNVTVPVRIYGNMTYENDEDFQVVITTNDGFSLSGSPATVRILNDDYRLSVSDINLTEGDSGQKDFTFNINLSGKMKTPVTVNYTTESSPGSASSSSDYVAVTSSVTFGVDDNATKAVVVKVNGDTLPESDETFYFTITNGQGVTIDKATGTGIIHDDDNRTISVVSQAFNEGDENVTRAVQVCINTPRLFDDLNVSYQTVSTGTATVGNDYNATSGTVTIVHGNACADVNITFMGDYVAEPDETFKFRVLSATPSLGITLPSADATITILNDDGTLSVTPTAEVYESNTSQTASMRFVLALTKKMNSPVVVNYFTYDGNATLADNDYVAVANSVTFAPNEVEKNITVTVIGDKKIEGNEYFDFNISNAQGVTITNATSRGTILEDDGRTISIGDVTVDEGDIGSSEANLTVSLNELSETNVNVTYTITAVDTDSADYDVSHTSGAFTIAAGQSSATIPITYYGDLRYENNERIEVSIATSTSGVAVADSVGYLTLINDDGMLSIGDSTIKEDNSTLPVSGDINVTLSRTSTQPIVIHYTMYPDTATAGTDYEPFSGDVTIPIGETKASIPIEIKYDVTVEGPEYFYVRISNDQNVTISDQDGNVTIVDDDLDVMTILDRQRAFGLRKGKNLFGNYAATGAPIMCALNAAGNACDWEYSGLLSVANTSFLHDNDVVMSTTNSSSADLSIDFDRTKGDTVIWAGLYWQGHIEGSTSNNLENNISGYNQVKLRMPNGTIKPITADAEDANQTNYYGYYTGAGAEYQGFRFYYQGFADVTTEVNTSLTTHDGRTFSVGNIKATTGVDNIINDPNLDGSDADTLPGDGYGQVGHFGGWSLVVIYEKGDKTDPDDLHNVSIFDGYKYLVSSNSVPVKSLDIGISGFRTPNSIAVDEEIDSKLLYFGGGSEKYMTGEEMNISNKTEFHTIFNGKNPANNPLNDTITNSGVDINPGRTYSPGVDLDVIPVGEWLDTNQTATTVRLTTQYISGGSDQAFAGLIGFSTQMYQPKMCYDFTFEQNGIVLQNNIGIKDIPTIQGLIRGGDTITAGIYLKNIDSDFSIKKISLYSDMNGSKITYDSPSLKTTRVNGISYGPLLTEESGGCSNYEGSATKQACGDGVNFRVGIGSNATLWSKAGAGSLGSGEFVYTQFKLDPFNLSGDVNESLNLKVDYVVDYENLDTGAFVETPIPGVLGSTIDLCQTFSGYAPQWGRFNVVDTNTSNYYNLYTQAVRKDFNVSVAFYAQDGSGEYTQLSDINTTVVAEIINVDSYNDINASCANPAAAVSEPVMVVFNDTDIKQVPPQLPEYYNKAVKNAAYRIWWFDDGSTGQTTLAENWTAIAGTTGLEKDLSSISNLYNAKHTLCSAQCSTSSASVGCYQCMKDYYAHPICSRDNFSIRPEAYDIRIRDVNQTTRANLANISENYGYTPGASTPSTKMPLTAGYLYGYDVNATSNTDVGGVSGYTRYFLGASDEYNATMEWDSTKTGCNDTSGQTLTFDIKNGVMVDGNSSKSQVGEYYVQMIDKTWTAVDWRDLSHHSGGGWLGSADCTLNSNSVPLDTRVSKVGCDISSSHTTNGGIVYRNPQFELHPNRFDLSTITYGKGVDNAALDTTSGANNFLYMADIEDTDQSAMALKVNGRIAAVDYNGVKLSNFVSQCYAKDLNLSLVRTSIPDQNVSAYLARLVDSNGTNVLYDSNATVIATNQSTWFVLSEGNFTKSAGGDTNISMSMNYDRNISRPMNPVRMLFDETKVTCSDATVCQQQYDGSLSDVEGNKTMNFGVTHYYGRAQGVAGRIKTDGPSDNTAEGYVRVNFEIFCGNDGNITCNKTLLPLGANTPQGEDRDWFRNRDHVVANGGTADTDGNLTRKSGSGSVTVSKTTSVTGSGITIGGAEVGFERFGATYNGDRGYPHTVILQNIPNEWLLYHPTNSLSTFNEFGIEFYKPSNVVGQDKANMNMDPDASVVPSRRIMW